MGVRISSLPSGPSLADTAPRASSLYASCRAATRVSAPFSPSSYAHRASAPYYSSPISGSRIADRFFSRSPQGCSVAGSSDRLALAAVSPSDRPDVASNWLLGRLSVAAPVLTSWSDDDLPLSEWAIGLRQNEPDGPPGPTASVPDSRPTLAPDTQTVPAALDLSPAASTDKKPCGGGERSQVAPEPEIYEVDDLSSDLKVISVSSGVLYPRDTLVPSSPPFRQQMAKELPDYKKRHRIHQRSLTRQLTRGSRNTRLVARLMATVAEKNIMPILMCPRSTVAACLPRVPRPHLWTPVSCATFMLFLSASSAPTQTAMRRISPAYGGSFATFSVPRSSGGARLGWR